MSIEADSEVIKPFAIAGIGAMIGEISATGSSMGYSFSASDSEADFCAELGGGLDFCATNTLSIGAEGSYVMGFNDMEEIRYFTLTVGAAYHF